MSAEIPAKITVSPKSKLTEREYKGYYIANGITTGINLHAPEGLTVTDCETFENSDGTFTCMPNAFRLHQNHLLFLMNPERII